MTIMVIALNFRVHCLIMCYWQRHILEDCTFTQCDVLRETIQEDTTFVDTAIKSGMEWLSLECSLPIWVLWKT